MTHDSEPAIVYVLRWAKAGRYYIGYTTSALSMRVSKHRDNGTKAMREVFEEHGDPERLIPYHGLTIDEARAIEAELIQKVRLVVGDALLNE